MTQNMTKNELRGKFFMFEADFRGHADKNFQLFILIMVHYHQNLYLTGFLGGFNTLWVIYSPKCEEKSRRTWIYCRNIGKTQIRLGEPLNPWIFQIFCLSYIIWISTNGNPPIKQYFLNFWHIGPPYSREVSSRWPSLTLSP